MKREGEGRKGKKMGESGERELRKELRGKTEERQELRKTPEGKRGGMGKTEKEKGTGERRERGGGNSFLWGVNKKPKIALFLIFPFSLTFPL